MFVFSKWYTLIVFYINRETILKELHHSQQLSYHHITVLYNMYSIEIQMIKVRYCQRQICIWAGSIWFLRCAWSLWWWCLCYGPAEGRFLACSHWPPLWRGHPSHHTCSIKKTVSQHLFHHENFTQKITQNCIENRSVTLCVNSPEIMTLCPSIQAMWKFQLQETLGVNPHKP